MGLLDFLTGKPKPAPTATPPAKTAEAAAPANPAEVFYVVKEGDTLWKIAETQYGHGHGARYMEIFEANKPPLTDPDKIQPGQRLRIPAASGASAKVAGGDWVAPEEIRKG